MYERLLMDNSNGRINAHRGCSKYEKLRTETIIGFISDLTLGFRFSEKQMEQVVPGIFNFVFHYILWKRLMLGEFR